MFVDERSEIATVLARAGIERVLNGVKDSGVI
jgi:hypothetical protein